MFQPGMPAAGAPVSARQRLRSIAACYNCSIPAFSRTPFHFAISPAIWALSSSGVELRASAPKLRTCLATLSRPSNSCIALFVFCTIAGAVPAGKASPQLGTDLAAKRLELLREVLDDLRQVGVLGNADNPASVAEMVEIQAASRPLGLAVAPVQI